MLSKRSWMGIWPWSLLLLWWEFRKVHDAGSWKKNLWRIWYKLYTNPDEDQWLLDYLDKNGKAATLGDKDGKVELWMGKRVLWVQNSVWLSSCPCLKLLWPGKRLAVKETKQNVWMILILTVTNVSFTKYSHFWMHISISSSWVFCEIALLLRLKKGHDTKTPEVNVLVLAFFYFLYVFWRAVGFNLQCSKYNNLSVDSMYLISAPLTNKKTTSSLQ